MTLPSNDHSLAECWNPHYHGETYKSASAQIFRAWYLKEYPSSTPTERLVAAPLCIFSGVVHSPYTCTEKSLGGIYAVCTKCFMVARCGSDDTHGLRPRCGECDKKLTFADCFQPVLNGIKTSDTELRKLVDPAKDPALTVAEICSLSKNGVTYGRLAGSILILTAELKISTGHYVDPAGYKIDSGVHHANIENVFFRDRWVTIDPHQALPAAVIVREGHTVLAARGVSTHPASGRRLAELLAMDEAAFKRQAVLSLGTLLNTPDD